MSDLYLIRVTPGEIVAGRAALANFTLIHSAAARSLLLKLNNAELSREGTCACGRMAPSGRCSECESKDALAGGGVKGEER